jgi:hypothetical protein
VISTAALPAVLPDEMAGGCILSLALTAIAESSAVAAWTTCGAKFSGWLTCAAGAKAGIELPAITGSDSSTSAAHAAWASVSRTCLDSGLSPLGSVD